MAMTWWQALVLAVIQGVTEWLPVSSSGHLLLAEHAFGIEGSVGYLLLLHAGTLAAVIVAFRARLVAMVARLGAWRREAHAAGWRAAARTDPERRLALWVVVGTLPIAAAGLALRELVAGAHLGIRTLWFDFLLTALLLGRATMVRGADRPIAAMRARDAVIVGLYQVLALLPGVSRSGATLAGAVERRLDWASAAEYSFLLSIPALAGAMLLEWRSFAELADAGWTASLIGFTASACVGYATIRWLLAFLRRARPWVFAAYCGILGIVLLMVRFA